MTIVQKCKLTEHDFKDFVAKLYACICIDRPDSVLQCIESPGTIYGLHKTIMQYEKKNIQDPYIVARILSFKSSLYFQFTFPFSSDSLKY